jgi:hypothetical protein
MFKDGFSNVSGGGRIFVHRHPHSCGDLGKFKKAMCVDAPGLLKTIMTQGEVLTTKTSVKSAIVFTLMI